MPIKTKVETIKAKVGLAGMNLSPMWVKNHRDFENSFVENPSFLRNEMDEDDTYFHQVNLRNWTIPFSRRFRAIRVWLTMKWYGQKGLRESSKLHKDWVLRQF